MSNEITKQILEEMLDHNVEVIKYLKTLKLEKPIADQLIRAITSVGANYSEAQDASSKRDFINKIYIAKKEASESLYWLKLIEKLVGKSGEMSKLQDRTHRFVMLLQKIINSTRATSLQGKG